MDLCICSGLKILNGQTPGDSTGRLTCHDVNGSSVVDYTLIHQNMLKYVLYFCVADYWADLSDHCLLSCGLKCSYVKTHSSNYSLSNSNLNHELVKFKWS